MLYGVKNCEHGKASKRGDPADEIWTELQVA